MEIERRWRLAALPPAADLGPDIRFLEEREAAQGYISCAPVVRIRRSRKAGAQRFILCVKGPGTLARQEIETAISEETFLQLADFIGRPLIAKRTRFYRLADGHVLECSLVDEGLPTAFCYAEVEFESIEAAHRFVPPALLGEEKTQDVAFSMSAYWRATREDAGQEET